MMLMMMILLWWCEAMMMILILPDGWMSTSTWWRESVFQDDDDADDALMMWNYDDVKLWWWWWWRWYWGIDGWAPLPGGGSLYSQMMMMTLWCWYGYSQNLKIHFQQRNSVYFNYVDFCSKNGMTPVNAASFGKVKLKLSTEIPWPNSNGFLHKV